MRKNDIAHFLTLASFLFPYKTRWFLYVFSFQFSLIFVWSVVGGIERLRNHLLDHYLCSSSAFVASFGIQLHLASLSMSSR
jgi:hypothetical protein